MGASPLQNLKIFLILLLLIYISFDIFSQSNYSKKENKKPNSKTTTQKTKENQMPDDIINSPIIPNTFTEEFGGGTKIRFQLRNLSIEGQGNVYKTSSGGEFTIEMELLHDCPECGNAINQVIVGLADENQAQVCVWNGKNYSGGQLLVVNMGTEVQALAEDNDQAEWVKVKFSIKVPNKKGNYYIRARYAQDYVGTVLTEEGRKIKQPNPSKALGWWKVDRPNGPTEKSNIGLIVVE